MLFLKDNFRNSILVFIELVAHWGDKDIQHTTCKLTHMHTHIHTLPLKVLIISSKKNAVG